jgi:hypothetical protein
MTRCPSPGWVSCPPVVHRLWITDALPQIRSQGR